MPVRRPSQAASKGKLDIRAMSSKTDVRPVSRLQSREWRAVCAPVRCLAGRAGLADGKGALTEGWWRAVWACLGGSHGPRRAKSAAGTGRCQSGAWARLRLRAARRAGRRPGRARSWLVSGQLQAGLSGPCTPAAAAERGAPFKHRGCRQPKCLTFRRLVGRGVCSAVGV